MAVKAHNCIVIHILETSREVFITFQDNIRDKLTPIGVQLNYSLREELPLPRRLTPILDVPNVVTVKVCHSWLLIHKFCKFTNNQSSIHDDTAKNGQKWYSSIFCTNFRKLPDLIIKGQTEDSLAK